MKEKLLKQLKTKLDQLDKLSQETRRMVHRIEMEKAAPNGDHLDYQEVAIWLGCSVATVKKYEKQGFLVARYTNADKRFHPEDVVLYMEGIGATRIRKVVR